MNWVWKVLIVVSLSLNLISLAVHVRFMREMVEGFSEQLSFSSSISQQQQQLRRKVNQLHQNEVDP